MAVPLQIKITEHEATLTAAVVPYGISMAAELDFAFLVDVDGKEVVMSPYEFACHDAACRPPGKNGGTGGSRKKGAAGGGGGNGDSIDGDTPGSKRKVGGAAHEADMALLRVSSPDDKFANQVVNADGTLGLPYLKPGGGGHVDFPPEFQAKVDKKLKEIGVTHEQIVENYVAAGLAAIDKPYAKDAIGWYAKENAWGKEVAAKFGVSTDRVFAVTSLISALRDWESEKRLPGEPHSKYPSTNKGAVEIMLRKLHDDEPFEITQAMADSFNNHKSEKISLGAGVVLKAGTYRPSDLSSSTLSRVATGLGWKVVGKVGTKPIAKAIAVFRGELSVNEVINGLKQRSFHSNLSHPEINYTSTNDLWHQRLAVGTMKLNVPDRRKVLNPDGTVSQVTPGRLNKMRATMKEFESHITGYPIDKNTGKPKGEWGNAPHALFTGGMKTKDNPASGGLYTELTRATRHALDTLAGRDVRFKKMKMHEYQALIWVYGQEEFG